jgi:hypothetical protein
MSDGLRKADNFSPQARLEAAERNETYEMFRDYVGMRLDMLQRQEREGVLRPQDLRSQFSMAIQENERLAMLLHDLHDAVMMDPIDDEHAGKMVNAAKELFYRFEEEHE